MHTVAVFRMERSERRSGIFDNILRCNPVYFLYPRAGIREVRAAVRTKTVLVKHTGNVAGQLFSLSAHRVQRLLDPLEIGDVLYRPVCRSGPTRGVALECCPQVYPANLPSADDAIPQIKGLSAHGSIPCPIEEGAVFRVNALQESLEGYWRTNIQAEHAAGFIGASEELRAKIEMPTARMGILVNLVTVSG